MSSPDLFVVCKSCGSEVSPYVTECPYCGTRLRKRAPKIEREGGVPKPPKPGSERLPRRGRQPKPPKPPKPSKPPKEPRRKAPRLSRLRSGEIPGVGGDEVRRPWATITLVALSFGLFLSLAFLVSSDLYLDALDGDPWRYLTAPFLNLSGWAQFGIVIGLGVFGWLLERRHGPLLVVALFVLCGVGSIAAAVAVDPGSAAYGTTGAALGFVAAWTVPVLLARRGRPEHEDDDADLLGVAVIAAGLLLLPVALGTSVLVSLFGGAFGALAGLGLAALRPR
jgi:membrane associated rhomboid family serine protease